MLNKKLTGRLAKRSGVTKAVAADHLDQVVHGILLSLKKGRPAELPGLGQFQPGKPWKFEFVEDPDAR